MQSDAKRSYEITVEGVLDRHWSAWFEGLFLSQTDSAPSLTTLTGLLDQAALRGVLTKVWDLNLTVVGVRRLPDDNVCTESRR